jgi:hypothetical protein
MVVPASSWLFARANYTHRNAEERITPSSKGKKAGGHISFKVRAQVIKMRGWNVHNVAHLCDLDFGPALEVRHAGVHGKRNAISSETWNKVWLIIQSNGHN